MSIPRAFLTGASGAISEEKQAEEDARLEEMIMKEIDEEMERMNLTTPSKDRHRAVTAPCSVEKVKERRFRNAPSMGPRALY